MRVDNPARRHYLITDKIEAGMVLTGAETKAIRTRGIQLKEAIVQIKEGEVFLVGAHIPVYPFAAKEGYQPKRERKLLLKKKEISWLFSKKKEKLTIIPLACYTKGRWIKVLLGVGRKKRKEEKKQEAIRKALEKQRRRGREI